MRPVRFYDTQYLIPVFVAFLGAVAVVRGHLRRQSREANWRVGKVSVEGQLTSCELMERSDEPYHWCSVEYRVKGIRYQLTGTFGFQPHDVGKAVAVLYDPKLPSEAKLAGHAESTLGGGGIASVAAVVAVILFFITFAILRSFA